MTSAVASPPVPAVMTAVTNDDIVTANKGQAREYEMQCLRMQNEALTHETTRMRKLLQSMALDQASKLEKKTNIIHTSTHTVEDKGMVHSRPMARCASQATQEVLTQLPKPSDNLATSLLQACQNPLGSVEYLSSTNFARDLVMLCRAVRTSLENESRCLFLQSPVYVFGDLHGNLEDLRFFGDNVWNLGLPLTAGKFLFLGDYVDRGMHSLEVVAYVFALKLQCPNKVFLLRGNHELRDVNGWEDHYWEKSFIWQCKNRFGDDVGLQVWEEVNQVFDRLPLSAVIDNDIFCVHGGIPRPGPSNNRIEDILMVPAISGVSPFYAHETAASIRTASECLWSDPAKPSQESSLDEDGYGASPRGAGAMCFGAKAVENFLKQHGYNYIVRAHEAHSQGVSISKGARVLTVFSTSKDHNQGQGAMAGCILIDNEEIQIINRSPKYKNRVIRRRCSAATMGLPQQWTEQGKRLGLIVDTASSNDLLNKRTWGRRQSGIGGMGGIRLLTGIFGGSQANSPIEELGESSGSSELAGLTEEDRDGNLVDAFVDICDSDDGHSSSDDEGGKEGGRFMTWADLDAAAHQQGSRGTKTAGAQSASTTAAPFHEAMDL
jgi:diadenosine tetraphosphatase ApaH/serine/threonine PP2A family protein phosphatase